MSSPRALRFAALAPLLTLALVVAPEAHAITGQVLFEGFLRAASGGPATDGDYDLNFAIHDGKAAALWSEGPVKVKVAGGQFSWALGSKTPLPWAKLSAAKAPEIRVKVGSDPALPGVPLYDGWVANSARGLACTGCVSVSQLKFDSDVNLGGFSLKAKNGTFTGDLVAASVSAQAFIGDGSKLTGIALPKGSCKPGQAVVGIAADGSLQCASSAETLPKDGLHNLSNGTLSNHFTDAIGYDKAVPIPDNTGSEATALVKVPNLGLATSFAIRVKIANTDLSAVSLVLLPPDDKKVGLTLCDPCGKKDEKALDQSWSKSKPPKTGDLGKWIGKNPAGLWTLKVKDTDFCVPQKPGNSGLCQASKGLDGQLEAFEVQVQTFTNSKVQATGHLVVQGATQLGVQAKPPFPCTAKTRGAMYVDDATDQLRICRKTGLWGSVVVHECGNKKIETGETCDDGNVLPGDGCDGICQVECGNGKVDQNEECDFNDPASKDKCSQQCKKIKYGQLWLDTPSYQMFPVPYTHSTYSESKAVALCKSVGLRLWRDESGSKSDPNWAYDWQNNHNLGGHDICYKVNSACSNQQQGHTGTWKLFGKAWSDDMKALTGATNGQDLYVLNHLHHSGSNETQSSWCRIRPQSTSVQWQTQTNGSVSGMKYAVVLCAKSK